MKDSRQIIISLFLLLLPLTLTPGCESASREKAAAAPTSSLNAVDRLMISAERDIRDSSPVDLPPPPTIAPAAVEAKPQDDSRARLALEETLASLNVERHVEATTPRRGPATDDFLEAEMRFIEGRERFLDGDYYEAVKQLEQARRLDPTSTAILRLLAQTHIATSGEARAREIYERILEIEPGDAEALLRVGLAYVDSGDWASAVNYLARILDDMAADSVQSPGAERLIAARHLGVALSELGYDRAAIEAWRQAAAMPRTPPITPGFKRELETLYREHGELWQSIGDAHLRLDEISRAVEAYERAAQYPLLEPEALLARLVYADLRRGRVNSALGTLLQQTRAVESDETLGDLLEYVRPLPESRRLAAALLELAEADPDSLHLAKAAAIASGDSEGGAAMLRYLAAHPEDNEAWYDVLQWTVARGQDARAVEIVIQRTRELNESPEAMVNELVALRGDPRALISAWRSTPSERRNDSESAIVEATLLHAAGRDDESIDMLDRALIENPRNSSLRLARIEWLVRNELIGPARRELDSLTRGPLPLAAQTYRAARAYLRAGQGRRGLDLLDDLADRATTEPPPADFDERELRHERIELLIRLGSLNETIQHLQAGIEDDPKDAWLYHQLLRLTGAEGPAPDSDTYTETARALAREAPESRAFRLLRAEQNAAFRSPTRAIGELKQLVDEDPRDADALATLIGAFLSADQLDEGLLWIEDRQTDRPGDPLLRDARIELLVADRDVDRAVADLRAMLQEKPGVDAISIKLEQTLRRAGRDDEAIQVARTRLKHRPESPRRQIHLARLAIEESDLALVLEHLDQALNLSREDLAIHLESLLSAAAAATQLPNSESANQFALRVTEEAIRQDITLNPMLHARRMIAMAEAGRPVAEIEAAAERASSAHPEQEFEFLTQARVALESAGRIDDAVALVDRRLEGRDRLEENDLEFVLWRLNQAARRDEPQIAIDLVYAIYESGLLNRGELEQNSYKLLAESLYAASGDFYSAEAQESSELLMAEALKIDSNHAMANNDLAYAWVDRNERLEEAERMLLISIEGAAPGSRQSVLDSLGWLRYKQGRFRDEGQAIDQLGAVSLLEQARQNQLGEVNPVILDHLGDAYWRVGRTDEARRTWREAKRAYERQYDLVAEEGQAILERAYGPVAEAAEAKIEAAEAGKLPAVAFSPGADANANAAALEDRDANGPEPPDPEK